MLKHVSLSLVGLMVAQGAMAGGYVAPQMSQCPAGTISIPGYIQCQACPPGTGLQRDAFGAPLVSRAGNGGYTLVCNAPGTPIAAVGSVVEGTPVTGRVTPSEPSSRPGRQ